MSLNMVILLSSEFISAHRLTTSQKGFNAMIIASRETAIIATAKYQRQIMLQNEETVHEIYTIDDNTIIIKKSNSRIANTPVVTL